MTSSFNDLRALLPGGEVLTPGDDGYLASLQRFSATCVKPAAVVIRPINAEQVSIAVRYASDHSVLPLAVNCGGHSTSGDSSSDGGMVIDLSRMRSVSVDAESQTITFDGGCLWADVNEALSKHGLATVSGSVSDTGVGGLILGGGQGFLTGRYGYTIDCLISCQVVLANGDIVMASKEENPDLFFALRGAGASFGVVTQFKSQAYVQGESWAGIMMFPQERLEELIEFGNRLMEETNGDCLYSPVLACALPPNREPCVFAFAFFNGTAEEAEKAYKPLFDMNPIFNSAKTYKTHAELNSFLDEPSKPDSRVMFGGTSFTAPLDPTAVRELATVVWDFAMKPGNETLRGSNLSFEYIPTNAIRKIKVTDSAYGNRGQYLHAATKFSWTDPSRDIEVREFNKKLCEQVWKTVGWKGDEFHDGSGTYPNYYSTTTKAEKAFGQNTARLRQLKTKYDPKNLFKKVVNLMPADQ